MAMCFQTLMCHTVLVDRWLEIEMGKGLKNRVVIHVECIRDPAFERIGYRPVGAEYVSK